MALLQQGVADDLELSGKSGSDAVLQSAVRKAALRFGPLLTIAYLFNYLDRTSLGFAALTMNQQLGLSASQFGLAAGIFFLGYSLFEVPSNLMLYRYGARRWLCRIMISWGIVSAATAFVVGPNSFYGLRLLLGITEAANWLTPEERNALDSVLASEVRERPPSSLLAALKDSRVLICAAIQFGFTLGSYGIGIWLPLMLKEYHLSTIAIGGIWAIPFLFASAGMILWG